MLLFLVDYGRYGCLVPVGTGTVYVRSVDEQVRRKQKYLSTLPRQTNRNVKIRSGVAGVLDTCLCASSRATLHVAYDM